MTSVCPANQPRISEYLISESGASKRVLLVMVEGCHGTGNTRRFLYLLLLARPLFLIMSDIIEGGDTDMGTSYWAA